MPSTQHHFNSIECVSSLFFGTRNVERKIQQQQQQKTTTNKNKSWNWTRVFQSGKKLSQHIFGKMVNKRKRAREKRKAAATADSNFLVFCAVKFNLVFYCYLFKLITSQIPDISCFHRAFGFMLLFLFRFYIPCAFELLMHNSIWLHPPPYLPLLCRRYF